MLRHPFCAGQVAVERSPRAIRLKLWIDVQHDLRYFTPVRPLLIRIEHTQISNDVLFVVDGEHGIRRCKICNVWISRRFSHYLPSFVAASRLKSDKSLDRRGASRKGDER